MFTLLKFTQNVFAFFIILTILSSCGKYDEGPSLSFRSRAERVANTWKIEQYLLNNADQTTSMNSITKDMTMTFTKDGEYSFSYADEKGKIQSGNGKWEFQNDDLEIKTSGVSNASSEKLVILRLKESSFWYYFTSSSDRHEYHLIPK